MNRYIYTSRRTMDEAIEFLDSLFAAGEVDSCDKPLIERVKVSDPCYGNARPRYIYAITLVEAGR